MKTGIVLEGGALRTIFSSGVTDGLLRGGVGLTIWWACRRASPMG